MLVTNTGAPGVQRVSVTSPASAFGEVATVQPTPTVQLDFIKGILSERVETFTFASGSVSLSKSNGGKEILCQSGATIYGYGLLRSKRVLRYRPGIGSRARWTSRWVSTVQNAVIRSGLLSSGTELSFGYGDPNDGTNTSFGILYRTKGRLEIQKLSITAAATGAETATVTLNSVAYSVDLTSGTAAHNCYEIASDSDFGTSAAFTAWQNGDDVYFVSNSVGDKTGTFSFSSTGTATGSFTEIQAGVATTDQFFDQADWNINTLTDATRDGFLLDPTKGNIFEVRFQYLGYGCITFGVADPSTGITVDVHRIQYSNSNTNPNLENPTMQIAWFAASLGSTTNVQIYGASCYASVDGQIRPVDNPTAQSHTKNVGTTLTAILSIRNSPIVNTVINESAIFPRFLNVAVDGTKPAVIELHINTTLGGEPNWSYHEEGVNIAEIDTSATTVSGNTEIVVIPVGKTDTVSIDLNSLNIELNRTDVITIAAKATSGTTDVTAALTWAED